MAATIRAVTAWEILDSRGIPTVRARVALDDGTDATASVPSGVSTGSLEAVELRDDDPDRYAGMGVLRAVDNVCTEIADALVGLDATDQAAVDEGLIELDGTDDKSRLGANAVLGASLAVARAAATSRGVPLYRHLAPRDAYRVPVPCMNIVNGGEQATNSLDFQEFMVVPVGAPSFADALRYGTETFHVLKGILLDRGLATSVGDDGGFAPDLDSNEQALQLIVEAIDTAGYRPGDDVAVAVDSAANSFSLGIDGHYDLARSGAGAMTADDLLALYADLLDRYPIVLWEDPMAEGDWGAFATFTHRFGDRIEVVGDDIFVTNTRLIQRGIDDDTANAAMIKLNQIGTVTEAMRAVELCESAGWRHFHSHRSGETDDTFLADFAVAMNGGHVKAGSASRGERVAKYNRIVEIEAELGDAARYSWT